ncbi:MAG: hypothetical protein K2J80_08000 [Oscillospiraceae bacterium]|nr:hypothetical protein [Oscillospiraceae bacterium]
MNKNALYLTFNTAALAAVAARNIMANSDGFAVVSALAFCCLFVTDYLINRLCRAKGARMICAPIGIAGCFVCGAEEYFPLLIMLIFELIDHLDAKEYFYGISAASAVLTALIFVPNQYTLTMTILLTVTVIFARIAVERVEYFRELSEKQRGTISAQSDRINKLQEWSHTLRETAALEERSRFSTRIHDKLGHGISGSIILLEGAKLNLKTNPEQAERSLSVAIENLRGSVDSIREALHEERPKRGTASAAELKELLERFSVNYEIKTDFSIEGDTEKISTLIWNCLKDNLTEALTNTVKHSDASKFLLKIRVYGKIIRAEFSDNGSGGSGFSKGMGLDGIEDRVSVCGGKCLFQYGVTGFKIINIFGVNYDQGIDSGR